MSSATVLFETSHFFVEPCESCPLPGYLIVRAKVAVPSLALLSPSAAIELGPLLQRVVRAVEDVVRPLRVYVAQFGEENHDLHFHVFPRTRPLTREYLRWFPEQRALVHGPGLLDWSREHYRTKAAPERTVRALRDIRDALAAGHRRGSMP